MASKPLFNYDEFIKNYRLACARRGIDPAQGASVYQVVHISAEQRRKAWQASRWWKRHELWLNCPPYRSEAEQQAIWNLFVEAYGTTASRIAQAVRLRRARMALYDLQQERAGGD